MRIVENIVITSYSKNPQESISDLTSSDLKPTSQRQHNHVPEDPAATSKVFAIRDQIARTEEHVNVVKNATGGLEIAGSNILTLNSILENIYERATKAESVSSQGSLDTITKGLNGQMEEVLQTANARYGDEFLFSGSINSEASFSLNTGGNLLFNGKQVGAYDKNDPDTCFAENKPAYLDVGFGAYVSDMNTAKSGVRISTSGVDVLGYGKDENGHSDNLYSLVSQVNGQLRAGDKNSAMNTPTQFKKKQSNISIATSEVGTWEKVLERTQNRLGTGLVNLQRTQRDPEAVKVEMETVTNESAETTWMITLQLGSNIISPSIFNFME